MAASDVKLGEAFIDVSARLQKVENQLERFENETKRRGKKSGQEYGRRFGSSAAGQIKRLMQAAVLAISAGFVGNLVSRIVTTSSRFESLRLRLEQLKGSAEAGSAAMKELVAFSAGTPFQLTEIIEAEATLESFGARGQATVQMMGDLAVFMGVSLPEAAAAFGRAFAGGAGAADIFRERGILNLIKMQGQIDDFKDVTLEEFRATMIDVFTDPNGRISGGTAKLAQTLEGRWSTFKDNLSLLFRDIGDRFAGNNKRILEIGIGTLGLIRKHLPEIIEAIGHDINEAFKRTLIVPRTILGLLQKGFDKLPERAQGFIRDAGSKLGEIFDDTVDFAIDKVKSESKTLQLIESLKDEIKNIGSTGTPITIPVKPEVPHVPVPQAETENLENVGFISDQMVSDVENKFDLMEGAAQSFFQGMVRFQTQSNNVLEHGFVNLANFAIAELERILAKKAALFFLDFLFPGSDKTLSIAGAHTGGTFMNGKKIAAFANGGNFTVPNGFNNDTFPMLVESGERVRVTPAARAGDESKMLATIAGRLESLEVNTIMAMRKYQAQVAVQQSIEDRGIQLTVERSERREARFR